MMDYPYYWRIKTRLPDRKGQRCRVLAMAKVKNTPKLDLTPDELAAWDTYQVQLATVVGEAVKLQGNGVQVLENERLRNGLCRLRLARYGNPPLAPPNLYPHLGGEVVLEMRWRDEDVPMHYLYLVWMEVEDGRVFA